MRKARTPNSRQVGVVRETERCGADEVTVMLRDNAVTKLRTGLDRPHSLDATATGRGVT